MMIRNDTMLPKISAGISITGDDFSYSYVSGKLGIDATNWRTKDDWPDAIKTNNELPNYLKPRTVWEFYTEREYSDSIDIQVRKIFNKFYMKADIINELCNELGLCVGFGVEIFVQTDNRPEIVLEKDIIAFLAKINAPIAIGIYVE